MEKLVNVFTTEEIVLLEKEIGNAQEQNVHGGKAPLGRLEINKFNTPQSIKEKVLKAVESVSGFPMALRSVSCVIYSSEFGQPNLPPHFDGDKSDLIVDLQISSNTDWGIGINLEVHSMEDNSAIIFNPNTNIHWRPIKHFKDGEYVKMLFLRFSNKDQETDYSHARRSQDDPIFKDVNEYRNNI
jgi:hypothetical protein